jgi:hypothetical protein
MQRFILYALSLFLFGSLSLGAPVDMESRSLALPRAQDYSTTTQLEDPAVLNAKF